PLPSDPDPNFPFRKHLEKSIVPNPKKAIQRIIRGETKAERRQRKEQDELNRLLKSKADTDVKPVDTHSKDWEFFQELTAQIEHTVQESASKVKVLLPSKPHPLEEDDDDEEDQTEDWAHFDSAFGSETEPAAVQTFNPWEDKIEPSEVSEEFNLESEGIDAVLHDGDMTDTLVQISDEPERSGLNEEEHQSITDLERDLGTEVVSEDTATGLTKDIDTFLGIEAANEPNNQKPLSSDPLQILECLKPKTEVDPLEELGLDLSPSTGMATDVVDDPRDLALADFTSDVQQESDHSPAESLDSSGPNQIQQSDTNPLSDDAEMNAHEIQYVDTSSKKQAIELPYQEDMDRSDVEDSTAVDDVLWGGFGEIHVEPNGHVGAEPDPFGSDDFGSAVVNSGNGAQPGSKKEANLYEQPSKDAIRPRAKPVRQETLSGNNPFRKRTSEDNEPDDELLRAAASIGLIGLQHPVRKHRDSFESSGSSVADDKLGNEQGLQAAGESTEEGPTDDVDHIENAKVPTHGFDPLQTIYPESDNESVASEEQTQTESQAISITIKDKPEVLNGDQTRNSPEVPTLTAPPRPQPVAAESKKVEPELISVDAEATDEPVARHPTPVGWVNFNSESAEILDETDKQLVPAEMTFEVDWSAPVMPPQRTEPEPPRPDTPDPELDIPFYPIAKDGAFYRLWLRYPEKKTRIKQVSKYTTDRYWREIAICFRMEHGRKVIDLHEIDDKSDVIASEPYRSIRIEPYMQLSREKLQQYDKYGKLHVFKLNHVTYREMVGIRPEKFSIKSLQNLVTHKPKQNVAVDHLPVYTEILKFGSLDQKKIRELMCVFEDALMQIPAHKDTSLTYNREEVCCYVVDEYQAHVSAEGIIKEQKARTRILCTAFVNGGPHIVLGLNDKWRYGREVVRRSDILPVMHDEWISIRCPEFHSCVELDAYEVDHMLKFFPLDGCRFELLRFRVSLRGNKELPMQVRTTYGIDGRRVSMRCELLVPGFFSASNRKGAVACENVEIHIPVPEDWIYHFRVEKHHKYGSVHSTLRKPGRIKGLERITQMAQSLLPPSILEASIGLAKYEHLYKAIVWRIPRIPEKHEASLRPHLLTCKLTLAQHDTVPEWDTLVPDCQVEYTMPSSTVSGATVRSVSVEHTGVAEKFVKYTSKYKYTVDIDYHLGERKEPPLKSMLDDQDSPVEQAIEEPPQVQTPVDEEQVAEPQGTEVADLLGLGLGFSDLSDNQTTDVKEPQETPGSADLL
ncbi:adaptor complexe medium subunit family protein, partial [Opisthorchis viverrini]